MNTALENNNSSTTSAAADPQPAVTTPEQIAEQLRALRVAIPQATLTARQKAALRNSLAVSNDVVQAQVSVLPVLEGMNLQLGATADDVRKVGEEANRWAEVISELKAMLREAEGTALLRQKKLHRLATQAYGVAVSLSRNPEYAVLVPHVLEIKRLRKLASRKKRAEQPPASSGEQKIME
jgi:hypothetical protein